MIVFSGVHAWGSWPLKDRGPLDWTARNHSHRPQLLLFSGLGHCSCLGWPRYLQCNLQDNPYWLKGYDIDKFNRCITSKAAFADGKNCKSLGLFYFWSFSSIFFAILFLQSRACNSISHSVGWLVGLSVCWSVCRRRLGACNLWRSALFLPQILYFFTNFKSIVGSIPMIFLPPCLLIFCLNQIHSLSIPIIFLPLYLIILY